MVTGRREPGGFRRSSSRDAGATKKELRHSGAARWVGHLWGGKKRRQHMSTVEHSPWKEGMAGDVQGSKIPAFSTRHRWGEEARKWGQFLTSLGGMHWMGRKGVFVAE